jgi:hypothetical protein
MTRAQKMQQFFRYYRQQSGKSTVTARELAEAAQKMGWTLPKPIDPMDMFAKQFSEAIGEETRVDNETNRPYKANLSFKRRSANGKQLAFWFDVDANPPRRLMVKGLNEYREQMVGEAVIGTNTAEHWNRLNSGDQPLLFDTDLTDDVNWRLNAPLDNNEAS